MKAFKKFLTLLISERRQQVYLSDLDQLEEESVSSYTLLSTFVICVFILSLIIWSGLTTVEEIAKTTGEVIPQSKVQSIQHVYGGVVNKVLVIDGEVVEKGQVLAELEDVQVKTELEKSLIQLIALTANSIRLKAKYEKNTLTLSDLKKRLAQEVDIPKQHVISINNLLNQETVLAEIERSSNQSQQAVLRDQISQHETELESLVNKSKMLEQMLATVSEELSMYKKLNESDLASKRELLIAKRQYLTVKSDLVTAKNDHAKQQKLLLEAKNRLLQMQNEDKHEVANKINQMHSEILQTKRQIEKLTDKLDKMTVRSPVTGIVNGLAINPGSVVNPSQEILQIVPNHSLLIVETKIPSRDIGFVKIGDPVRVKVTAYDFARYGGINGKIKTLSASTFVEPDTSQVYYKGTVELEKNYIGHNPRQYLLKPGMLVEADIYTGDKSLLAYLLKPIHLSVSQAFNER